MDLTVKKAKSIIKEAQKQRTDEDGDEYQVYEGEMPDDDSEILSEAQNLIDMAVDARDNDYTNDAIDKILFLAEVDGGTPSDPNDDDDPEPTGDLPIEDYDDLKTSQIIGKLPDLDADELAAIYDYESENKNRPSIIAVLEEIAAESQGDDDGGDPDEGAGADFTYEDLEEMDRDDLVKVIEADDLDVEHKGKRRNTLVVLIADALGLSQDGDDDPEPDPEPDDDPEPDPEPEPEPVDPPWRGYQNKKMDEILKVLPKKDDETLAATFEYEEQNKNRQGIIKALQKLAEERGLTSEPDPEPDDDPAEEVRDEARDGKVEERTPEPERDHEDLIAHITKRVDEEHLAVPQRPPEDRFEIPFDMTELSDRQLRRAYSAARAYFARAAYVAKVEGQISEACKNIAEKKSNEIIAATKKVDPETKKEKTATVLKAEAESDPTVAAWRERQHSHGAVASSMKRDVEIFDKDLEAISREWTMRHEEISHQGGLRGRGK